jgi:hypothetical protein
MEARFSVRSIGKPRPRNSLRTERPAMALLCLSLILLLGPTITVFASAHLSTQAPNPSNTTLPQAVNAILPPGFTPSNNRPDTFSIVSNTTTKTIDPSGLNDGYCFYGNGSCGQVTYHGGAIMHNALVVIVLWAGCGSNGCLSCSTGYFDNATIDPGAKDPNDCTYGNLQVAYLQDFCAAGNPLLRIINQYTDRNGDLNSCSVYGGRWYLDYNRFPEKPLSDADIQREAMAVLNGMNISANTNTAIFMFTPYGVSSCAGSNDCFPTGNFCAYHNWFWSGTPYLSSQVVYSSMPDDGWAGVNCGLGGPSPNHDPFADLEVFPLFHEAVESFTDPTPGYIFGEGWYYDGYQEIADQCAYDFVGTQPADGSNVRLGLQGTVGDPYRIQSIWSNANGGCTLDLEGPPALVRETLDRDVSTGTPASTQEFPIHYQEAGETGSFASVNSTCCGVATDFYATLGSSFTTEPVLGPNEHWCFDASCSNRTSYVLGFTALEFYYFDLLQQSTSYEVSGGGSIPAPKLSYETAPSGETPGDSSAAETLFLSNGAQDFWSLRGSTITVAPMLASGTAERWAAKQATWAATTADAIPPTIVYYHQYSLNFSYSVVDGGAPIPPNLSFFQLGTPQDLFLGTAPATYWLDSGTSFQVNNVLSGSTSTERWIASQTSGTADGSVAVTFVYYHQYSINASYSVIDGGTPAAPSLSVNVMGMPFSYQMTQAPVSTWMDANSWSVPNTLVGASSFGERWAATGKTNGTLTSNALIAIAYYHQFEFDVRYSVSDNSLVAAPRLTSETFGDGFSSPLSTSTGSFWLDSGANWSLNHLLNGSGDLERWMTNSPTGGVVSAPLTTSFEFLHEFYVTIQTAQKAGGSTTPTGWYNATASLVLGANANDGWQFERWDGTGPGNYSGPANFPVVTILSPIVENATFYPGLMLASVGNGQISYHWGTNQGRLSSEATLYVPLGTNVTLTATAASPFFTFNGYNGALVSGRAVSSVVVNGPSEVKASFGPSYDLLFALFGGIGVAGAGLVYYLRRTRTS